MDPLSSSWYLTKYYNSSDSSTDETDDLDPNMDVEPKESQENLDEITCSQFYYKPVESENFAAAQKAFATCYQNDLAPITYHAMNQAAAGPGNLAAAQHAFATCYQNNYQNDPANPAPKH